MESVETEPIFRRIKKRSFFNELKRRGFEVDRIVAVDGPATTLDDLAKAIKKSQSN